MTIEKHKQAALDHAIDIAKAYAAAGLDKDSPAKVIRETYKSIVKILDDMGGSDH